MAAPTYIIGIDSGGTEMRGCLLHQDGRLLARATQASANFNKLRGEIVPAIVALTQSLCAQAQSSRTELACAGFCATGVGRPADRKLLHDALQQAQLAPQIVVESDALAALTGAFAGGPGIIVNAGTGAIAHGRTHAGNLVRVGGWGYLLGDEGSGYYLAKQALNAALQDWDGRGEPTKLRAALEKHFAVTSIELAITQVYDPAFDRGRMAELAPLVFSVAEAGDLVAQALVAQTGNELGRLVAAVVKKFALAVQIPIALLGNLFRRAEMLLPSFWNVLAAEQGRLEIVVPRFDPTIGAALLALQLCGKKLDQSFLQNLERTAHESFAPARGVVP